MIIADVRAEQGTPIGTVASSSMSILRSGLSSSNFSCDFNASATPRRRDGVNSLVISRGLNFIFDSFGATRPVRLGLALGLSFALEFLVPLAKFPLPGQPTLATCLVRLVLLPSLWAIIGVA
jgi:hypothetical protein